MKKYYLSLLLFTSYTYIFSQIYVKQDASGTNDGTSWDNAYTNLQTAINAANTDDEIWVAYGTYKPIESPDANVNTDLRSWCFYIDKDIKLFGGFTGTESSVSERDFISNTTVLSGEIGNQSNLSDNSHHVIIITGTSKKSLLDGFTITRGNAKGGVNVNFSGETFYAYEGGGIYIKDAFIVLKNLVIHENKADRGGGMYLLNANATPFADRVVIENVTFSFNDAISVNAGGGLLITNSNPLLYNTIFEGNRAELFATVGGTGGGVTLVNSTRVFFYNPVFYANFAYNRGSAIVSNSSEFTIYNGTFVNNSTRPINLEDFLSSNNRVFNSVFYNNGGSGDVFGDLDSSAYSTTYNASDSQPPYDEIDEVTANFVDLSSSSASDIFVDIDNPKGPDNIWRTIDDGLMPNNSSPLLEAAGVSSGPYSQDVTGEFRFFNTLDLGAYENPGTLNNDEFTVFSSTKIYPNPTTNGFISISSKNNKTNKVEIYSTLGKKVLSSQTSDKKIDVSNLNSGVYIVKITDNNNNYTSKKFVVGN